MATIEKREKGGKLVYRVKIRRKGYSTQTGTFTRLTDARRWAQSTEAAIDEGRHFKTTEAKRHTLAEMVDRYIDKVLPDKSPSSIYMGSSPSLRLEFELDNKGLRAVVDKRRIPRKILDKHTHPEGGVHAHGFQLY